MIIVVSGLPRSGTSLMMQMLAAGGLVPLTDGVRTADESNPRGYFEWEKAKELPRNPGLIAEAEGKVVKIISMLLLSLPQDRAYKVIFMERPIFEIAASQTAMIKRLGTNGSVAPNALPRTLEAHLRQVKASFRSRPEMSICPVAYGDLVRDPRPGAEAVREFLGIKLDLAAMAAQVDRSLYRQKLFY